jgi:hypothetical protein
LSVHSNLGCRFAGKERPVGKFDDAGVVDIRKDASAGWIGLFAVDDGEELLKNDFTFR